MKKLFLFILCTIYTVFLYSPFCFAYEGVDGTDEENNVSDAILDHTQEADPHTGYMLEAVPTNSKAAAYTVGTDNANECYGGIIYVTSAAVITACDGLTSGMNFAVITIGAIAVSVDPQDDDLIVLDGTALTDGQAATNTSTAGDIASCSYYNATGWYCSTNSWVGP